MSPFLRFSAVLCAVLVASGGASAQSSSSCPGRDGPVRLNVVVEGVRNAQGLIAVTLYADDSSRFLAKRGSLYVARTPATAPTTSTCINLPSTGIFALGIYHDEDADRSYDRTSVGLPSEGFGFSNNPPVVLGIPSFRSVRLSVPRNNMSTRIKLRYP